MRKDDTRFTDEAFAEWMREDPARAKWSATPDELSRILLRAQQLKIECSHTIKRSNQNNADETREATATR
jgi:hypothetical protein